MSSAIAVEMGEHYFQRGTTYQHLKRLSGSGVWVVYVGLGATVDRTDVDWVSLVEKVIHQNSHKTVTPENISTWVRSQGPQRAATTAEALLRHHRGRGWLRALNAEIRDLLYGSRVLMAGSLLESLSDWAHSLAAAGGSVLFVTPNYDDYLYRELIGLAPLGVMVNPVEVVPERNPEIYELPANWKSPGTITCLHVHGYVPENDSRAKGTPALGELTYQRTSVYTASILESAFRGHNIVIVGSSVSDAPLVQALIQTAPRAKRTRLAVLPLQGAAWHNADIEGGLDRGVQRLNEDRLSALGLEAVTPDYYGQVAQLFYDASDLISRRADLKDLEKVGNPSRYDSRIENWWRAWEAYAGDQQVQRFHHKLLASVLPHVKADLGAIDGEGIKIEVWSRWDPNHSRSLALWAASIGTWNDHRLMRRGPIALDSEHMAVKVFCSGSPQFEHESPSSDSRWRSYFGFPVWEYTLDGSFMAGVVIIASMWPVRGDEGRDLKQADGGGSITDENLKAIQLARLRLDDVADLILASRIETKDDQRVAVDHFRSGAAELPDLLSMMPRHLE